MPISTIGTDGIAAANVTQAKLATNVVGNGPAFRVVTLTNQTVPHNTTTVINLDGASIDTSSCVNTANKRVIPNVAGYYQVDAQLLIFENTGRTYYYAMYLRKNGSQVATAIFSHAATSGAEQTISTSSLIYCNGTTDYLDLALYLYDYTSATSVVVTSSSSGTFLSGFLARSA
jgi:hypothetical protein